jgi:hypothetical protein
MKLTRKQLNKILKHTDMFTVDGIMHLATYKYIPKDSYDRALVGSPIMPTQRSHNESFALRLLLDAYVVAENTLDVCGTKIKFFTWQELSLAPS